jgi:deoxyuridine 5'-triphosphate nucleotidohydrolase
MLDIGKDYIEPGEAFFVKKNPEAIAPVYKSRLAACADIALPVDIVIRPREVDVYKTGLIVIPPQGWHWHVYLRSSIPIKYPGIVLANCVGIIDSDYIGPEDELGLVLLNQSGDRSYSIKAGERVAQMRLVPNARPTRFQELTYEQVQARRSRGGFGSTSE